MYSNLKKKCPLSCCIIIYFRFIITGALMGHLFFGVVDQGGLVLIFHTLSDSLIMATHSYCLYYSYIKTLICKVTSHQGCEINVVQ